LAADPASDPRDPVVHVIGHRVWNAQDACLDHIVTAVAFPKLPYELRSLHVEITVPDDLQPLVLASPAGRWTDPVAEVQTLMRSDFQKKPTHIPFTAESCFARPVLFDHVDLELSRGERPRYLRENPASPVTKFDSCLEFAMAKIVLPDLPQSFRSLVVRFGPMPPPSTGSRWVDEPAWPRGDRLEITWLVSEVPDAPGPMFAVEVIATIGDVSRRVALSLHTAPLKPSNQTACAVRLPGGAPATPRLGKDELASIGFGQPAVAGYLVRRGPAGDSLAIDAWDKPSGGCIRGKRWYNPCPRSQHVVALMHAPASIELQERIIAVDASGAQHPLRCAL
jgi:hypothetical protein